MATPQPLMSVAFRSGDDYYKLTSRGKLFVEWMPAAWREVTHQVLAQRVLYGELAKHITPQEEPDGAHLP